MESISGMVEASRLRWGLRWPPWPTKPETFRVEITPSFDHGHQRHVAIVKVFDNHGNQFELFQVVLPSSITSPRTVDYLDATYLNVQGDRFDNTLTKRIIVAFCRWKSN